MTDTALAQAEGRTRARRIKRLPEGPAEIGKDTSTRGCPGTSTAIARQAWAEIQLAMDSATRGSAQSPTEASSSSSGRSACTSAGTLVMANVLAHGLTRRASMAEVPESHFPMTRAGNSSGPMGSPDTTPDISFVDRRFVAQCPASVDAGEAALHRKEYTVVAGNSRHHQFHLPCGKRRRRQQS